MNMVMALDVNPVTGDVFAVGTEARHALRFEPTLQGTFVRVHMASFDPASAPAPATIVDLNPHIDYATPRSVQRRRNRSIGDPRAIAGNASGTLAYVAGMGSNDFTASRMSAWVLDEGSMYPRSPLVTPVSFGLAFASDGPTTCTGSG